MLRKFATAIQEARRRAGRRHAYRRLDWMSDRMLADIGVTREDVIRAIRSNDDRFADRL